MDTFKNSPEALRAMLDKVKAGEPLTLLSLYTLIGASIKADSRMSNVIFALKSFELLLTTDCLHEGQQEPTEQQLALCSELALAISAWSELTCKDIKAQQAVQGEYPIVPLNLGAATKQVVDTALKNAGKGQ